MIVCKNYSFLTIFFIICKDETTVKSFKEIQKWTCSLSNSNIFVVAKNCGHKLTIIELTSAFVWNMSPIKIADLNIGCNGKMLDHVGSSIFILKLVSRSFHSVSQCQCYILTLQALTCFKGNNDQNGWTIWRMKQQSSHLKKYKSEHAAFLIQTFLWWQKIVDINWQ